MLWLNFKNISVDTDDSAYPTAKKLVKQHDRLTVSDTSNKVVWFFMADSSEGDCLFQDPEWSTHGGFVVTLRSFDKTGGKCKDENQDYGIMAIRMVDKKRFYFYGQGISDKSTPHLWIDPSAQVDTTADTSTGEGFFGTMNVRLTYVDPQDGIVFVDLSKVESLADLEKTLAKPQKLKKPSGLKDWLLDSPMFSPDGEYIVFNAFDGSETSWESYVQELSETSSPVKMKVLDKMMSPPAQPHWYKNGDRLFVVWTEFPSGSKILNLNDLRNPSVQGGDYGRTAMREVSLKHGGPADFAVEWVGDVRELAPVPMMGGRSPDGRFLATGTNHAFMLKLP